MNVLVPVIDKVKYVHSLKEITVDIPLQLAVTSGGSGVVNAWNTIFGEVT